MGLGGHLGRLGNLFGTILASRRLQNRFLKDFASDLGGQIDQHSLKCSIIFCTDFEMYVEGILHGL